MKTNKNQQQLRVKIQDTWYFVEILDIDSNPAKVLVDGVPVDVKIHEKPKVQKTENISQKMNRRIIYILAKNNSNLLCQVQLFHSQLKKVTQ